MVQCIVATMETNSDRQPWSYTMAYQLKLCHACREAVKDAFEGDTHMYFSL